MDGDSQTNQNGGPKRLSKEERERILKLMKDDEAKMKAIPSDKLEKHTCPICKKGVIKNSLFSRYPNYICDDCKKRAINREGFPVEFYNTSMSGGFVAKYKDGEGRSIESEDHTCFIDGIECYAEEGHFGGIVIQPVQK